MPCTWFGKAEYVQSDPCWASWVIHYIKAPRGSWHHHICPHLINWWLLFKPIDTLPVLTSSDNVPLCTIRRSSAFCLITELGIEMCVYIMQWLITSNCLDSQVVMCFCKIALHRWKFIKKYFWIYILNSVRCWNLCCQFNVGLVAVTGQAWCEWAQTDQCRMDFPTSYCCFKRPGNIQDHLLKI